MSRPDSSTGIDQNGLSLRNHGDVLLKIAEEDPSNEVTNDTPLAGGRQRPQECDSPLLGPISPESPQSESSNSILIQGGMFQSNSPSRIGNTNLRADVVRYSDDSEQQDGYHQIVAKTIIDELSIDPLTGL